MSDPLCEHLSMPATSAKPCGKRATVAIKYGDPSTTAYRYPEHAEKFYDILRNAGQKWDGRELPR